MFWSITFTWEQILTVHQVRRWAGYQLGVCVYIHSVHKLGQHPFLRTNALTKPSPLSRISGILRDSNRGMKIRNMTWNLLLRGECVWWGGRPLEAKISEGKAALSVWAWALLRRFSPTREKEGRGSAGSVRRGLIFIKDAGDRSSCTGFKGTKTQFA